jgi:hypothetical protein
MSACLDTSLGIGPEISQAVKDIYTAANVCPSITMPCSHIP